MVMLIADDKHRYSIDEVVELRRKTLRYARSFPLGAERNRHRQIAMLLRGLLRKNTTWLVGDLR